MEFYISKETMIKSKFRFLKINDILNLELPLKYGTKIIFTVGTVNDESFNFVMKKDCIRTKKINEILYEHKLLNCIINKE